MTNENLRYLLIGAGISFTSSLFISLLLFYLNRREEKRQLELKNRSEIIGICDNLIKNITFCEFFTLRISYHVQCAKIAENNPKDKEYLKDYITLTFKTEDRLMDAVIEYGLLKSRLLEKISELSNHITIEKIKKIKAKFDLLTYKNQEYDFSKCDTREKIEVLNKEYIESIGSFIKTQSIGKYLEEIKKDLNPLI